MINVGSYEANIVYEFYAIFLKNVIFNPASKKYAKTFVRGMICGFSPSSINRFFGLLDEDTAISLAAAEKEMV